MKTSKYGKKSTHIVTTGLLMACTSTIAVAQDFVFEEIVVTATKRAESVQDVPISISAFSGDELETSGVETLQDIQFLAPGLSLPQGNALNNFRIIIRGIGSVGNSGIEPSVATFVDGTYIARPGALLSDLVDMETVEVIRGPQGTLFGRNSTVGALNLKSKNPGDEFEAVSNASYGAFNDFNADAVLNLPLSDTAASRFALSYSERDGYGENIRPGEEDTIGDRKNFSGRAKLRFDPTETLSALVSLDYSDLTSGGPVMEVLSSTVTPANTAALNFTTSGALPDLTDTSDYTVNQRDIDRNETDQFGTTVDISLDIGEHTLRSISAYRDWNFHSVTDPFRLPIDLVTIREDFETETLSQEFQILSPTGGTLEYVAGLYYYDEDYRIDTHRSLEADFCGTLIANIAPAPVAIGCARGQQEDAVVAAFEQSVKSYAVFGQATINLSDQFSLVGGLRWNKDEKDGYFASTTNNAVLAASITANEPGRSLAFADDKVTYHLSLNYRPTDDVLLYATHNTGYKSGGFNSNIAGSTPLTDDQRIFDSETVENYEIGAKTKWANGRVIANINLFQTEIDDFQDRNFDGIGFQTSNAGTLRQKGVEFDVRANPVDRLSISVSGSTLDSEFISYTNASNLPGLAGVQDLTGKRAHFSPKLQLSSIAEWTDSLSEASNLEWFARTEWSHTSSQNVGGRTNQSPQSVQEAYDIVNVRMGIYNYEKGWKVVAFLENAFDKSYCQTILEQVSATILGVQDGNGNSLHRCALGTPRTWGIKLNVEF